MAAIKTAMTLAINDDLQKGNGPLSVPFGCTSGKHRSVYVAQKNGHLPDLMARYRS
ncbi:RapZ C-terminal domain-containing protein [Dyadobacter jejuensis]|uniref:RapZ C-terminal domain-containing protein n=1 Tax=Dyadobacter jejuensis TaxID=1082580 RepID=UPI0011B25173